MKGGEGELTFNRIYIRVSIVILRLTVQRISDNEHSHSARAIGDYC